MHDTYQNTSMAETILTLQLTCNNVQLILKRILQKILNLSLITPSINIISFKKKKKNRTSITFAHILQADSLYFHRLICTKTIFFLQRVNTVFAIDFTPITANKHTQLTSFHGPGLLLSLNPVQMGNIVWWPNIFLFGNIVWSCLTKFEQRQKFDCKNMFKTIWLLSKTLATKQGLIVFGHQTFFSIWPEFYTTCLLYLKCSRTSSHSDYERLISTVWKLRASYIIYRIKNSLYCAHFTVIPTAVWDIEPVKVNPWNHHYTMLFFMPLLNHIQEKIQENRKKILHDWRPTAS